MHKRNLPSLIILCFLFSLIRIYPIFGSENSQAVMRAKSYIEAIPFSRDGLIRQLEFHGYSHDDAKYAADNCGADWNEQAVKKAESYLQSIAFSEKGLINQLESTAEGFTHEQAVYALEVVGPNIDWKQQAVKKAESYLQSIAFSEKGLINQLESTAEGFTHEQAVYALEIVGPNVDWNEQAVKSAESYLNIRLFSRKELIKQLESEAEGFTHEQAVYGADHATATYDDMIDVLSKNLENIFPIRGLEDAFNTPMVATYSDVGPATAVQISNQEGMRNISLYANADLAHDYNVVTKLNAGNLQNFLISMDVRINDVYPSLQGGCFIGYTNESISAIQAEEIKTVSLLVDGQGAEFYIKGKEEDSGSHFQISGTKRDSYRLTLIRLTGQTFAFIDGRFAGQLFDDAAGPFQLVYGTALFSEGDLAECSFDNLVIRKVVN